MMKIIMERNWCPIDVNIGSTPQSIILQCTIIMVDLFGQGARQKLGNKDIWPHRRRDNQAEEDSTTKNELPSSS